MQNSIKTRLNLACVASRGRRHESSGADCEDVVVGRNLRKMDLGILVLADGAGSASHARLGAELATSTVLQFFQRHRQPFFSLTPTELQSQILGRVLARLNSEATTQNAKLEDFACTLLFAVSGENYTLFGQIGDGYIGVLRQGKTSWQLPFALQKNEYLNETCFVTSAHAASQFQTARVDSAKFAGCILMSDGAGESLYHRSRSEFAKGVGTLYEWATNFSAVKLKNALKRSLDGPMRTKTFDDLSVGIMVQLHDAKQPTATEKNF